MLQNGFFYVSRSEFWPYFLQSKDAKYLLMKNCPTELQDKIFNEFVQVVNIETSAFCNRRCSYCPISVKPRQQKLMDDSVFKKIITELVDMDYRGTLKLSLFNEPLADRDILKRVSTIKEYLPVSYLSLNSNGDYITTEYLDELSNAGLNEIIVTMHMLPGQLYSDEIAEKRLRDFVDKLGLVYLEKSRKLNHNITLDLNYKNIRLLIVSNNWNVDGTDRGGVIEELSIESRVQPCCTSFREVVIDVEGSFRYCFNLFVDSESIGNVKDSSLKELFFSDLMVDKRKNNLVFGEKVGACRTCNTYDYASPESNEFRKTLIAE